MCLDNYKIIKWKNKVMFLCYAESQKSFRRDPVQKDHSEGMNDMIVIIAT